jgi:3D (Asp-Asp-Asp) domain-containing protein
MPFFYGNCVTRSLYFKRSHLVLEALMKILALLVGSWAFLLLSVSGAESLSHFEALKKARGGAQARAPHTGGKSGRSFTVTLTTYWAIGNGSDYWTRKHTSSTGQPLVAGVSVAADPRVIPYGSIIDIKGVGRRVVKDTGSHVVKRVASLRRGVSYPVIDLFFERREDALRFARSNPAFAEVRVVKLGS